MTRLAMVVLSLALASSAVADAPIRHVKEAVPGEYVVILKDGAVPRSSLPSVATEFALRGRGRVLAVMQNGLSVFALSATEQDILVLAADPRVEYIEENQTGHLSYDIRYFSDDTYWHLDRIDQRTPVPQWPTKAYAWTSTGMGVDVYVVDTGIWSAHSEFARGNVTSGANYAINDGYLPTAPCGGFRNRFNGGHGTAVASIIGGNTVGVAPDSTLIPVKIAQCYPNYTPPSPDLTIDAINVLQSLDWVLGQVQTRGRRSVVNMSIYFDATNPNPNGVGACYDAQRRTYDCRPVLENNVRNLLNAGAVVVASANNQNANHCSDQSPARMGYGGMYDPGNQPTWPFVITAGGTDINDARYQCGTCDMSQRGSNFGQCVDVYAPARMIHGAHIAATNAYRDQQSWVAALQQEFPGSYEALTTEAVSTGTSFAAPVVSGVAARLLQMFPYMTVRDVWDNINANATALPANFDGDGVAANDKVIYVSPNN